MFSPKEENIWKKLSSSSTKTKVVVVGFLGGSSSFSRDLNLNALFGREASSFARLPVSVLIQLIGRSQLTSCNKEFHELEREVECYYDEGESVVYVCTSETSLEAASRDQPDLSPLAAWESLELRKKLLLFIICHIIVWIQPNSSFDLSCLETLRVLEKARHRFQSSVISLLRGTSGVSDAWCKYGRFCCPRVIFYFPNLDLSYDLEAIGKQKLQNAMEDKIYRVLRRDRHITNIAMNSLFALPADKHFVALPSTYLPPPPVDFMEYILERCHESVQSAVGFTSSSNGMPHPYDCQLTEFTPKNCGSTTPFELVPLLFEEMETARTTGFDDNFGRTPVTATFELPVLKTWCIVASKLCKLLFLPTPSAGTSKHTDRGTRNALATLQASCEVAKNFSEKKCRKAVPLAKAAYAESLPASYGRDHHERRMGLAAKVFYTHARGPSLPAYWNRLMEQCEAIWNDGHRLCEAKSLRGHECTEPRHRTTAEATQDKQAGITSSLPVGPHHTSFQVVSACNCGRTVVSREDPFTIEEANCSFYEELNIQCCSTLWEKNVEFPVFEGEVATAHVAKETSTLSGEEKVGLGATSDEMKQPKQRPGGISKEQPITIASEESTPLPEKKATPTQLAAGEEKGGRGAESRAEEAPEEEEEDERVHLRLMTDAKAGLSQPEGAIPSQLGTNAEVGPKEADGVRSREEEDEGEDETQQQTETPPDVFDENKAEGKPTGGSTPLEDAPPMPLRTKRLISRTEYLSGMLHSRTPEGVLPRFQHWSLLKMGPPNHFVSACELRDLPCFWPNSRFLLPWEIHIRSKEKWPTLEGSGKRKADFPRKGGRRDQLRESSPSVVKGLIGFEYECPQGHRFIASSSDRVIKGPIFKDTASKVMSVSMPVLFVNCPCRTRRPSQLMRLHVVTPPSHVRVSLLPRVIHPAAPETIFHTGLQEPLPLDENSYWVLRLPYAYMVSEESLACQLREGRKGAFLHDSIQTTEIQPTTMGPFADS